ncbi:methyltransferase domain-containing protein [Nonomuraea jiangxiensis]|nr:methyltransferase domain-containing protein [Nonomuraea jiangxiensis]
MAAKHRLELADKIGSASWRKALETVPRELFLGDAVYVPDKTRGDLWTPVRRSDMSTDDWLTLVYADATLVTQVAGITADAATGAVTGCPTSSSTLPSLVVRMLEAAQIGEGDRVLEIGTGTGYSTALMCHRLGNAEVTSVEYDSVIASRARAAITAAGFAPALPQGDGLYGYAENAEYDRVIATCSVRTIPYAWVRQLRAGGTITAPMGGWMGGVAFAHLTLTDGGTASGRFLEDSLYFMTARAHWPPPRPPMVRGIGEARKSRVDPSILEDRTAVWIAQLAIPQAQISWGDGATFLVDAGTGSRAEALSDPGGGGWCDSTGRSGCGMSLKSPSRRGRGRASRINRAVG